MKQLVAIRAAALLVATSLALACAAAPADSWLAWLRPRPALQPLAAATTWLNGAGPGPAALQGKVVLLDFWTYSCINCLRTLPYVKAWDRKYRPYGLVVIGVHTPEFAFERGMQNVQRASRQLAVDFPVVLDSDRAIWKAAGVQGWPTMDLVDTRGQRRHRQLGEGEYVAMERAIQQLLREAGRGDVPTDLVAPAGEGTQAAPAQVAAQTEETYLGAAQASAFVTNGAKLRPGATRDFAAATSLRNGEWSLTGRWRVDQEHIESAAPGAAIAYRFRARDLHVVLGPMDDGRPVRVRVLVDGKPPGADHGTDVDAAGQGVIDTHRLYQLVRQGDPRRERLFQIEFIDPGVRAYAFTFG
jgi:thiol-disulfide isomerase/thioredoxin